jgi:hypothetical protein
LPLFLAELARHQLDLVFRPAGPVQVDVELHRPLISQRHRGEVLPPRRLVLVVTVQLSVQYELS